MNWWEHIVVVSLARRADRRTHFAAQAKAADLVGWRFFDAFDAKEMMVESMRPMGHRGRMHPGEVGCALSHMALARAHVVFAEAAGREPPPLAVFEDDVAFAPDFVAKAKAFTEALPKAWSYLHFGTYHDVPRVTEGKPELPYRRLMKTWGSFGYVLRGEALRRFAAHPWAVMLREPIDVALAGMMGEMPCYGPTEPLLTLPNLGSDCR